MKYKSNTNSSEQARILLFQIDRLNQELSLIDQMLTSIEVEPALFPTLRVHFPDIVERLKQEVYQLENEVPQEGAIPKHWVTFAKLQKKSRKFFDEYLAFLQGYYIRQQNLDSGLCQVADALLQEISHWIQIAWRRFTIMGEFEFYSGLSEIICLRFPDNSIWSLPFTVHEFGHFVFEQKKADYASVISNILFDEGVNSWSEEETIQTNQQKKILEEQFADLFAVYTLGPAFACSTILLLFDPNQAFAPSKDHPNDAERAYFILKALQEIDSDLRCFSGIISWLQDHWQMSLTAVNQPYKLKIDQTSKLDKRLEKLFPLLRDFSKANYTGWNTACSLANNLLNNQAPDQLLAAQSNPVQFRDLLNAAWICRLKDTKGNHCYKINSLTLKLCNALLKNNPASLAT